MLYTFFDVETSGLRRGDDVLSFSYMLADENLNVKRAETLYFWKEGVTQWTQEAYEINKLSKDFLRQYEADYQKNLDKMYIVLSYADLVGYNSGYEKGGVIHGFDFSMCKNFLERNDMPAPVPASFLDVMMIEASMHGGHKKKLQVVFDSYGIPRSLAEAFNTVYFGTKGEAHESSYDVVCTALIFKQMRDKGIISDEETVNYNIELEEVGDVEYSLYFNEKCQLVVHASGMNDDKLLSDFVKENPVMGEKITANPYAYLRKES